MNLDAFGTGRPVASVLVPAFREAESIASTVERVAAAVAPLDDYAWELVVVDDGSPDDTSARCSPRPPARSPSRCGWSATSSTRGSAGALRTGFAATTGSVVIVLDADLSYDESHIAQLLHAWEQTQAHVVLASPYMPGGQSTGVPPAAWSVAPGSPTGSCRRRRSATSRPSPEWCVPTTGRSCGACR